MKDRIKKLLKNNSGIALTELLVSIVIVSLSGMLISSGISFGARKMSQISDLAEAKTILSDYSLVIENGLINGRYICDYNEKPVFENKKYNCAGYYDEEEGEIVFKAVKIDAFNNVIETNNTIKLIPRRNLYGDINTQKYLAKIIVEHKTSNEVPQYTVNISICIGETTLSSSTFNVYEKGGVINT